VKLRSLTIDSTKQAVFGLLLFRKVARKFFAALRRIIPRLCVVFDKRQKFIQLVFQGAPHNRLGCLENLQILSTSE
jgi:hypothetical protein